MSAQAKALQIDYEAIGQVIYMTCITYIIKIIKVVDYWILFVIWFIVVDNNSNKFIKTMLC